MLQEVDHCRVGNRDLVIEVSRGAWLGRIVELDQTAIAGATDAVDHYIARKARVIGAHESGVEEFREVAGTLGVCEHGCCAHTTGVIASTLIVGEEEQLVLEEG